jgi:hypothetical protein
VVECLPCKHEALSSNPNTTKKKILKNVNFLRDKIFRKMQLGMGIYSYNLSYLGAKGKDCKFEASLINLRRTCLKIKIKGWGCHLVIEHLPRMYEVLRSIPSTTGGKKEQK